jgi:hypothetical protein
MKKILLIIFLLSNLCFLWSENIDVIMMVDTSWSLWQPFDDIVNYLINSMLDEILAKGDTFHLLQFSTDAKVEITEQISDGDTKEVIKNKVKQLRAPLKIGKYTDLLKAIDFLYNFTDSRPEKNEKLIILITDGIHDPPPGSNEPTDLLKLKEEFINRAREIKKKGWNIHILQIPPAQGRGETASEDLAKKKSFLEEMARELGITIEKYSPSKNKELLATTTGFPQIIFPDNLGEKGSQFQIPFMIKNTNSHEIRIKLTRIDCQGENILDTSYLEQNIPAQNQVTFNAPIKLPGNLKEGPQKLPITLIFEGDTRIISTKGDLLFTYIINKGIDFNQILLYFILPALGLALLVLIVLMLIHFRRRGSYEKRFREVVSDTRPTTTTATTTQVDLKKEGAKPYYADISYPIEMIVELQKRHIGFRNIHKLPKNKSLSVGGGHSSFLIFLVPVPAHIAEIHFDGRIFIFTPRKKEFFPHLGGPVKDCLLKDIPAVSAKGYEFSLFFRRYVSPLEEINNLMRSIRENASKAGK